MRIAVRIAGLAAAAALVLWCAAIGTHSFERQPGAGWPLLDGGAGLQLLLGMAALVSAGLVVAGVFALTRPACRGGQPFWLVVCLLGWAALAASVASRASELFIAHVNYEMGVGPGDGILRRSLLGGLVLDRRSGLRRARRRLTRPLGARRPRGRARQPPGLLTAGSPRVGHSEIG